jgi:hypothetical protein
VIAARDLLAHNVINVSIFAGHDLAAQLTLVHVSLQYLLTGQLPATRGVATLCGVGTCRLPFFFSGTAAWNPRRLEYWQSFWHGTRPLFKNRIAQSDWQSGRAAIHRCPTTPQFLKISL